ncbi:hypothetical protein SDJN03_08750, partial [Cucurbita argyrosperma subsp. sororia]
MSHFPWPCYIQNHAYAPKFLTNSHHNLLPTVLSHYAPPPVLLSSHRHCHRHRHCHHRRPCLAASSPSPSQRSCPKKGIPTLEEIELQSRFLEGLEFCVQINYLAFVWYSSV